MVKVGARKTYLKHLTKIIENDKRKKEDRNTNQDTLEQHNNPDKEVRTNTRIKEASEWQKTKEQRE